MPGNLTVATRLHKVTVTGPGNSRGHNSSPVFTNFIYILYRLNVWTELADCFPCFQSFGGRPINRFLFSRKKISIFSFTLTYLVLVVRSNQNELHQPSSSCFSKITFFLFCTGISDFDKQLICPGVHAQRTRYTLHESTSHKKTSLSLFRFTKEVKS